MELNSTELADIHIATTGTIEEVIYLGAKYGRYADLRIDEYRNSKIMNIVGTLLAIRFGSTGLNRALETAISERTKTVN